jgi:hypothetical protein
MLDPKRMRDLLNLPDYEARERATPSSAGDLHKRVHRPALDWFNDQVATGDDALNNMPEEIKQACHCLGLNAYQDASEVPFPTTDEELSFFNFCRTLLLVGAALYRDAARGNLVFDGTEE